eukprot:m.9321 g.9321  ORF g.9321 m.9321 type:complete len:57 (-) comp9408_c1_seq4:1279-1449(-)
MGLEEWPGFLKAAFSKNLLSKPEADESIEIRACFASPKARVCTELSQVRGIQEGAV